MKRKSPLIGAVPKTGMYRWPSPRPLGVQWATQRRAKSVEKNNWVLKTGPRLSRAELEADAAKRLAPRKWECPVVYGPAAVGRIVEAFGNIPPDLDRQRLGHDFDLVHHCVATFREAERRKEDEKAARKEYFFLDLRVGSGETRERLRENLYKDTVVTKAILMIEKRIEELAPTKIDIRSAKKSGDSTVRPRGGSSSASPRSSSAISERAPPRPGCGKQVTRRTPMIRPLSLAGARLSNSFSLSSKKAAWIQSP